MYNIETMCYPIESRDQILVKYGGFLPFTGNMGKSVDRNIRKTLRGEYSQKFFDLAKKFATDATKIAAKKSVQKTAEAMGNLIGNKTADKMTKVSKKSTTK